MKKNKNFYKLAGIFFILFFASFFITKSKLFAAESWYYTTIGPVGTDARVEVGGFTSKDTCLTALKVVHFSWNPSPDCYLAQNVKITSFSPTQGKYGDVVTINGSEFKDVQKVLFGTTEVNNAYVVVDSYSKIRILQVPASAVTGKITVKTKIHGEAVSSTNFVISLMPTDMRWWYRKNVINNPIQGPFLTLAECNTDRIKFGSNTQNKECFQETIDNINRIKEEEKNKEDNPTPVDPKVDPKDGSGLYTLLAPIGDFKEAPTNVGDYFNIIFKIVIGLCGALAVVMIVIGGVQYMGDESIFGKTEAKSRITSAIIGLLIALGSYALLNTINPDLLGGGGVSIEQVSAEIEDQPMIQESIDLPTLGTPINQCQEGIERIQTNGVTMHVCKRISTNVKTMITLAWSKNINLSGSAFRSRSDQIRLRTVNKCPDIYTSPASMCKPPTAIPGTSNHESGLAIDFKCEGQIIRAKDNKCFIWLTQNAGNYGLKNFSKEPWHWSIDGH